MPDDPTRPGAGGGESAQNPVTLREYLEKFIDLRTERFDADFDKMDERFKRVEDRFTAMQRAVDKFEEAQRERDLKGNEFRKSLEDQANRSFTKPEAEALERALGDRIGAVDKSFGDRIAALEKYQFGVQGHSEGEAGARTDRFRSIGLLVTIGFFALAIVQLILHFLPTKP